MKNTFTVKACWDEDAKVFYSESDITGLHIEANSIEIEIFEEVVKDSDSNLSEKWAFNKLISKINEAGLSIENSPISSEQLNGIIYLIEAGDISIQIAELLFEIIWREGGDPIQVFKDRGMTLGTITVNIEAVVDEVMADNLEQVEKAKQNPKITGWLVGQVMKQSGGNANPAAVLQAVKANLHKLAN